MEIKQKIYNWSIKYLIDKQLTLLETINQLGEAKKTASKSSVGDKHETSRAMMHLEEEKLLGQLSVIKNQINTLHKVNLDIKYSTVQFGSLVCTKDFLVFVSVGLGAKNIDGVNCYFVSVDAPIFKSLQAKHIGDFFVLNGKKIKIDSIF